MATWWIAPTITFLGVASAYVFFWLNRKANSKVITYQVNTNQPLVSNQQGWEDLVVQYAGQAVAQPRVISMRFENRGAVELRPADFDQEGLGVRLESREATIVSSSVLFVGADASQRVLESKDHERDAVSLPPTLLNPGDALEVRLLVDGPGSVSPWGRLAGFKLASGTENQRTRLQRLRRATDGVVVVTTVAVLAGALTLVGFWALDPTTVVPEIEGTTYALARDILRDAEISEISLERDPSAPTLISIPLDDWIVVRVEPEPGTGIGRDAPVVVYLAEPSS